MNLFYKQSNYSSKKVNILFVMTLCIGLFLWFTAIQEEKIIKDIETGIYYDQQMKEAAVEEATHLSYKTDTIKQEAIKEAEELEDFFIRRYQSFLAKNQSFFLKQEMYNQSMFKELSDAYKGLDYKAYRLGKVELNKYLINHRLRLKPLNYSTDSAIFTMNVLEFLTSPLFFLGLFLLLPITYFKKYEDGRIRLLLTQPISKRTIILKDYKLFLKQSIFALITIVILASSLSFIISHEFSLDYPVQLTLLGESKILPIYLYLLVLIGSFIFIASFIFFFTYMILLIFKKTMLTLFISMLFCLAGNTAVNFFPHQLDVINPFAYLIPEKVVKSSITTSDVKEVYMEYAEIEVEDNYSQGDQTTNMIENPYYYANQSLAKKTGTIDLIFIPVILFLYSLSLFFINVYLLEKYQV